MRERDRDASNVFEWLDFVRARRSMYARTITELESLIYGYHTALVIHDIRENVPGMTNHFATWLREMTNWSVCNGWGFAFENHTPPGIDPFDHFFSFVDQYRLLKPTVIARITLSPKHQPTGRRVIYGFDGRMDRPDEILAVNYKPTQLNHLRHRYGDLYEDDWFLTPG